MTIFFLADIFFQNGKEGLSRMKCPKCHFKNPDDSVFCSKCGTQILFREESPILHTKTLQMPITDLKVGSTFGGRYQVLEEIGSGGMGKVYRVLDIEINEKVALKLLNPLISSDETMIERFRNELKTARKISHKNVCRMYHIGEEEGNYYITMEYVSGEDLKNTIRRVGQLSIGKAISIAKQIYEGLAEAHKLGIVHRDLKPQNIMIDREGNVRIMDFGIARFQESKGLTDTGTIIGTPEYISPEQVEGKKVDQRSDIYSSGVILYEMLTGEAPFTGDTPLSVAVKHKTDMPKDPKEFNIQISQELSHVILKCMDKKKEKRYQSTKEILSELSNIEKEIPTREMALEGRKSTFLSFLRKLKKRKIKEEKKYSRKSVISKLKWAAALILTMIIALGAYHLWREVIQPQPAYENFILLDVYAQDSQDMPKNVIEYLLYRSLSASTESRILIQQDLAVYKQRTEQRGEATRKPIIEIKTEFYPNEAIGGFEIFVSMRYREKTTPREKFECRGRLDLISNKIDEILSFLTVVSDEKIGNIEGDRTFSQICTNNWEALTYFLKGEAAWDKLDSENAIIEYSTAIENDPDFSLARLKLADVLLFRGDRKKANENLQKALENEDRLIEYDKLKLKALMARLQFNPSDERNFTGQLAEAFPYKKEYHYEYAEAYFHYGEADEAIKQYSKAIDLDSNYSLVHNHIAFCYSWIGEHDQAKEHFKKYVALDNTANSFDSIASGYMFGGEYDEAIKALNKGIELDPNLDYLYGNLAQNYMLKGHLNKATEALKNQIAITGRENTQINSQFYNAFIEYIRGNYDKAIQQVIPCINFYSDEQYNARVDESPTLPFWLRGVIAFKQGDSRELREMIRRIENKLAKHKEKTGSEVNVTNYFPIFKYHIHLKILEAQLNDKEDEIFRYIREGKRIKNKMGYWSSIFNISYFFNEYAEILFRNNRIDQAYALLKEAIEYNPNYAPHHINMAKIYLIKKNINEVRKEYRKAQELLSTADEDYIFVEKVEEIGKKLSSLSESD